MSGQTSALASLLLRRRSSSSMVSISSSSSISRRRTSLQLQQVIKQQNQKMQFGTTITTTVARQKNYHQQNFLSSVRRYNFIRSTRINPILPPSAIIAATSLPLLESFVNCCYYYYYYFGYGLNSSHPCYVQDNNDKKKQQILAFSSTTHASQGSNSFIQRWLQLLQRWIKSLWHGCLVTTRIVEVTIRLSPLMILGPISWMTQSPKIANLSWDIAIMAIQGIGPVAIKFCQWVATRRDIFPPQLCNKLAVLHDKGCPHSWEYTHEILVDAFGPNYDQQGLIIDSKTPIGCGSAAQVYKGRLVLPKKDEKEQSADYDYSGNAVEKGRYTATPKEEEGRMVAIKVLHPNFTKQVERDLELIEIIAGYLHALPSDTIKMINLPRVTENFGIVLKLQADLTNEARNLQKFRYNFYHDRTDVEQQSHITFPKPISSSDDDEYYDDNHGRWNNDNPKVLIEDFVHDAVPISTYLEDSTPEGLELRRELAGPLLRAFLKMVFMDNFVHGDLHPGNVLVKTAKVESSPKPFWDFWGSSSNDIKYVSDDGVELKHSIVFLDAGIANSLSPEDKRNLKDLFKAVIFNEGYRAGELMVERAQYERCSTVPGGVDAFAKGVEDIVSEFHDRRKEGLTLGAVRIGSLLSRVLDLCRIHGVEIDPRMANVVLSTLVLEGLGRSLAPELDLMTFAKPFVIGLGKV